MKCLCCGRELTSSDRFCPNCGENNESYVEVVQQSNQNYSQQANVSTNQPIYQPINRVPIHLNDNDNFANQNNVPQNQNQPVFIYNQTHINPQSVKTESKAIGILAIVFSALGGWLGLLFSIIGLSTYQEPENRLLCKIALFIFLGWVALLILLGLAV